MIDLRKTLSVYSVQGTQFTTVTLARALSRAKDTASKSPAIVMLDGKPVYTVNKKGTVKTIN